MRYFVISLPERSDRLATFNAKMAAMPFANAIERHVGVKPLVPTGWSTSPGAYGCYQSHLAVLLRACLGTTIDDITVFEDDAFPVENADNILREFFARLPDDWCMAYLGGQHVSGTRPTPVNEHVLRGHNVNRMHAYCVRASFIKTAVQHLMDFKQWGRCRHHCDWRLGELHTHHPTYVPVRWAFGQDAGLSDITGFTSGQRLWQK